MNEIKIKKEIKMEETIMNNKELNIRDTKITTGKIILYRAHLFEKWSYKKDSKSKYCSILIIPKTDIETIEKINIGIKKAMEIGKILFEDEDYEQFPIITPLKDGDNTLSLDPMYIGNYYMIASSDFQPKVVDKDIEPLSPHNVADGTFARASLLFKPSIIEGKKRISCILSNVQLYNERYSPSGVYSTPEEDFA